MFPERWAGMGSLAPNLSEPQNWRYLWGTTVLKHCIAPLKIWTNLLVSDISMDLLIKRLHSLPYCFQIIPEVSFGWIVKSVISEPFWACIIVAWSKKNSLWHFIANFQKNCSPSALANLFWSRIYVLKLFLYFFPVTSLNCSQYHWSSSYSWSEEWDRISSMSIGFQKELH